MSNTEEKYVTDNAGSHQESDSESQSVDAPQQGVEKAEAIATAWGKNGLIIAYVGLLIGSIIVALESNTTYMFVPAATSAFFLHHALSTVTVVQNVLYATVKPPMAKIADVFGRTQALVISLLFIIIGYVMKAASKDVGTFVASQIFNAAGSTGLIVFVQIFVADTTSLLNRALFSSLPDFPYVFTTWAAPELAASVGTENNWRWGFGMWAIMIPASFLPLLASLVWYEVKAKKLGLVKKRVSSGPGIVYQLKDIFFELDLLGLLLLTGALIMILVPLTLTGTSGQWKWDEAKTLALLIVGFVIFAAWIGLEITPKVTPRPMFSWTLIKDPTVLGGCGLGFFYFFVYYLPFPYFYSWQQVVRGSSTREAGNISNIFTFSSCTMSIIISLIIKYTGRYKLWMMLGIPIYVLGYGLMIAFRTQESTDVQIIFAQILTGIGGGTINVPAQVGIQAAAGHANVATATAMFLTLISVGGAVGGAVAGSIWSNMLPKALEKHLAGTAAAQNVTDIYNNYFTAQTFLVGTAERAGINAAYAEVYRIQLIVACCVAIPMIPLGLMMKNIDLREKDLETVKGTVIGGDAGAIEPVASEAPPVYSDRKAE